ncbi:hypothetical protein [Acidaminococcus sp.]|uniref:hypothetical protein n=1 Tax=Acidaminococcus sp. TaxID=1872103 RepID=UPI003D7D0341
MKVFFEGTPETIKCEMAAWISGAAPVALSPQKPAPAKPAAAPAITAPVDEPVLAEVPKTEFKSGLNPVTQAVPAAPVLFNQAHDAQPAPAAAPIPKAPDKTYSREDLMRAAAQLMDKGLAAELAKINTRHGVKSFNRIPEAELGQVAVELRSLGAQL